MARQGHDIRELSPASDEDYLNGLGPLLHACVSDGASVNFIQPFSLGDSRAFWFETVRPAVFAGKRVLLAAYMEDALVGSVQLICDTPPNQPHRAEISKLLVHPACRRRGIARALMIEIERRAVERARSLLTLDTASAGAEALYRSLGYETVGRIPGYSRHPFEDRCESTTIMFKKV